jgi:putative transposase
MRRFKSGGQAQRFVEVHGIIGSHRPRRHLLSSANYRRVRSKRFQIWNEVTGATALASAGLTAWASPHARNAFHPIKLTVPAQAVKNCAFDPVLRKARKSDLPFRVEPRGSVKESKCTCVHQVFEVNVYRQVFMDTNGNCFDQR